MQVQQAMTEVVLTVGPGHTLRAAAGLMAARSVGAAIVLDPDAQGPAIITERDILLAVGAGDDVDRELVGDHLTSELVFATPQWPLERAAEEMIRGGFRHMVVMDGGETAGMISARDILRCWTGAGAVCDWPSPASVSAPSLAPLS
jgi:CBS domain-containing protein